MKCPEGDSNQVQMTLAFSSRDQGQSRLAPSPSCHSLAPAKKSSCCLWTRTVLSMTQGCLPSASDAAPHSPAAPGAHSSLGGARGRKRDPRAPWKAPGRCRRGWEARSPFPPRNGQEGNAALPRARPHNDRKPFGFSKNTGPKVGRPQQLLLCQPNLRKRKCEELNSFDLASFYVLK